MIPYDEIPSTEYSGLVFAVERMETVLEELKPLHLAHWEETEGHMQGIALNPNYASLIAYERNGGYILFTVRKDGRLVGDCSMYLATSMHTQLPMATEDSLFFLKEIRGGFASLRFQKYIERVLRAFGVKEVIVSVKTMNKANVLLERMGFKAVAVQYSKII
jgi:hypothetical protein